MATAFAERERDRRGLEDSVEIITGGTHPAGSIHDEVVAVTKRVKEHAAGKRRVTTDDLHEFAADVGIERESAEVRA